MNKSSRYQVGFCATALFLLNAATYGQTAAPWSITGNAGTNPGSHFLGTTDKEPLIIQPTGGLVGVGTTKPNANLDVQAISGNAFSATTTASDNHSTAVLGTSAHGFGVSGIGENIGVHAHNSSVGHDAFLASPCCAGDFFGDVRINGKTTTQTILVTGLAGSGPSLQVSGSSGAVAGSDTGPNKSGIGVSGTSVNGYGVSGTGANIGVYAHNSSVGHDAYLAAPCCAGDFHGDVYVHGRTTTQVLEITGGSDLAEPFQVSHNAAIKPGLLVTIDPSRQGQLQVAQKAYDRTVAGVLSGANGINPGLVMQDQALQDRTSLPVALSGRVYCWAEATNGPIQPGDLLTTSDIPGHAMKVMDYARAQGAVIGKAMSRLEEGTGLVLVLITLQ